MLLMNHATLRMTAVPDGKREIHDSDLDKLRI